MRTIAIQLKLAWLGLVLLGPGSYSCWAVAATHWVPAQYPTIQAAIDASADGDIVRIADGIYTGAGNRDLTFNGKAITVESENGPDHCIIDCQAAGFPPGAPPRKLPIAFLPGTMPGPAAAGSIGMNPPPP